jgi:ABC-2 type transport system permease protein
MHAVYILALRQLSGRWRLALMAVLAALPVIIAAVMVRQSGAPSVRNFEVSVLSTMLSGSIGPLIVLAIAAAAFANELEDRTLANLTLTPLARWQIVLPKLLASVTVAGPFIAASALATSYIAFLGDARAILAVTVSALVAVVLYAAAFTWLGLVTTQAIGIGLMYVVLWEGFLSSFVIGVRALSIRHYSIAIMNGLDPRRFADFEHVGLLPMTILIATVIAGFFWLSVRRLRRMDVP